jgi:hypothetical protein
MACARRSRASVPASTRLWQRGAFEARIGAGRRGSRLRMSESRRSALAWAGRREFSHSPPRAQFAPRYRGTNEEKKGRSKLVFVDFADVCARQHLFGTRQSPPIRLPCRKKHATAYRSTGPVPRSISGPCSRRSASKPAMRRVWTRQSAPIRPPCRNGHAIACRSTGPHVPPIPVRRRPILIAPFWGFGP